MNVFDYLDWRSDLSFKANGFNEMDGAIFARLSYFPFDDVITKPISISNAYKAIQKKTNIQYLWPYDKDILPILATCTRFKRLKLSEYVNEINTEDEMQFGAVTIQLSKNLYCVSFRGTDNTLVGWKEDFNMSFTCPVPSQLKAIDYLNKIMNTYEGNFIVLGHSKGGNLAVYSSIYCQDPSRIQSIYNYDGPGFDQDIIANENYKNIASRIHTFIPQSSIVGMLLEHEEEYTIIQSKQTGVLQHDVYSWQCIQNHFIYLDNVTGSSQLIDRTLKDWLTHLPKDKREKIIDAVYEVFQNTNAKTMKDLSSQKLETTKVLINSLKDMDKETKDLILQAIGYLFKSFQSNLLPKQFFSKFE